MQSHCGRPRRRQLLQQRLLAWNTAAPLRLDGTR
jgi:hypothetical protein